MDVPLLQQIYDCRSLHGSRCDESAILNLTLQIVIPVYNEAENFPHLHQAISCSIRVPFIANIIYDFDEDTTVPVVRRVIENGDTRFRLLKNTVKRGVVGALLTGFRSVSEGPVLVVMGDLSDDLTKVEPMLELYREGWHIVAPSRYMRGGKLIGGPFLKRNLSRWAGRSLRLLRGLPTSDPTNAFKLYDAQMLHSLNLESDGGFELGLEITVKAFLAGYRIAQIPATWTDRTAGESRFRLWHWLPKYLRWYSYAFRKRSAGPRALAPR